MCDEEIKELEFDNYEIVKYGDTRNYLYIKRKCLFSGNLGGFDAI